MPIQNFEGETFVAFVDISGFKEIMKNTERTIKTIDHFYQIGYDTLKNDRDVNGLFISDCGILFTRNKNLTIADNLESLLFVVEKLNKQLIRKEIMLTTSVAYGKFTYENRLEFKGIEKNPLYGNAYVNAFLDNENGKPKIQPGYCRILPENIPNIDELFSRSDNIFNRIRHEGNYYVFYWMVNHESEMNSFINSYNDSYQLKYKGMLNALQNANRQ
jgi:hypothetical protein